MTTSKPYVAWSLTAAAILASLVASPRARAQSTTVYKIGVLAGLSGLGSQIGQWMLQGVEVGSDVAAKSGQAIRFSTVAEDSQWNPQKGLEGFNKLVNVDKIDVLVSGGSSVMEAVAPLADQRKLVLMNTGAQSPKMAGIGTYTFSVLQLADFDIKVLASYAFKQMSLRKAAVMYVNNDTGKFNQAEFAKDFEKEGGKIVATEAFKPNETNYGVQVAKVASAAPDCVYMVGTPAELPFAVKQLRAVLPKVQILSYAGLESQEFLNAAGDAANGIVYTTTHFDPSSSDPNVMKFAEAYRARYGSAPSSPYVGYGYDAIQILAIALAEAKEPGEKLRDTIMRIRRFPGVAGESVFRDDGTVAKAIDVKVVKNGKYEALTVVNP
jgi:branched-chain amino acid transport system substrate-binding protein